MRKTWRIAALTATVILLGTAIGGTAGAQETGAQAEAGAFNAKATADALTINLFGNVITSSAVSAEVKPSQATATVTETLLGPINEPTPATATQPGGEAEATTESCTGDQLTAVPGIVRFDVTCGIATASHGANDGASRALGAEIVIEPSASELLDTLTIGDPAAEGVNEAINSLNEQLVKPITGGTPLNDLVQDGVTTVQDVLNDVLQLQSTARIVIAPALAETSFSGCDVTASARAQAVRVELLAADVAGSTTNGLLPEDLEAGEPLVVLTIADAESTKTASCTGESTGTDRAALACVEIGSTALGDRLGLPTDPICIEGGQTICVLEGTELESCISLAAAGSEAGADAASIQVFKGVNGGIDIATGRAATAAQSTPPAVPAAAPAGELPRTGGAAILPIIGGGLLAAAAISRRFAGKA